MIQSHIFFFIFLFVLQVLCFIYFAFNRPRPDIKLQQCHLLGVLIRPRHYEPGPSILTLKHLCGIHQIYIKRIIAGLEGNLFCELQNRIRQDVFGY